MIEALGRRVREPRAATRQDLKQWDDAYAAEMRRVYYSFQDDHDVMALFVEASMMRTVRSLWTSGRQARPPPIPMSSRR